MCVKIKYPSFIIKLKYTHYKDGYVVLIYLNQRLYILVNYKFLD